MPTNEIVDIVLRALSNAERSSLAHLTAARTSTSDLEALASRHFTDSPNEAPATPTVQELENELVSKMHPKAKIEFIKARYLQSNADLEELGKRHGPVLARQAREGKRKETSEEEEDVRGSHEQEEEEDGTCSTISHSSQLHREAAAASKKKRKTSLTSVGSTATFSGIQD